MWSRWLPAGVAALVLSGIAPAASRVDWPMLRYFNVTGSTAELYVSTGSNWHTHVIKALDAFPAGLVPDWAKTRGLTPKPLWLAVCTRAVQNATFRFSFQ